ncbi:TM2 domain-containing protein [Mycoplasma sp. 480]|uniref:TM2 domain-containing protein n=1 Tax=Mycoplasma sp. 480 TaxID=3440155 RepID=UPI003F514C32
MFSKKDEKNNKIIFNYQENKSEKNWAITLLISLFLGLVGIDRLYIGKFNWAKTITAGGLGVWYIADLILIMFGLMKDKEGKQIK